MDGCISTAWTDKKFYGMDTGILEFFLLTGNELGIRWWVSGYTRRKTNTDTHRGTAANLDTRAQDPTLGG